MPKTSRVIQTLAILLAVTTFASGCKTLEVKASESYEYWRIRTGGTSVAAFYTENGLQETCHGFWAKDYRVSVRHWLHGCSRGAPMFCSAMAMRRKPVWPLMTPFGAWMRWRSKWAALGLCNWWP